jgi:hypothetical protein
MAGRRITMQVNGTCGLQHAAQFHQAWGHHRKVGQHVVGADGRAKRLHSL